MTTIYPTSLNEADEREFRRLEREELRRARTTPPAFQLVDDIPGSGQFVGRRIPEQREQLIAFAKANRGRWVEYRSTEEDPFKSATQFAGAVRQGRIGFGPKGAFEAASRGGRLFVRFVGEGES
ncbi:hypothetical protein [Rhodococcus pyridinivorans]|uniref:hypothetical protein n=1 Tax=Rhodococcus pyridinivorans TaxID=103816 RepID=UPI003AAC2D91